MRYFTRRYFRRPICIFIYLFIILAIYNEVYLYGSSKFRQIRCNDPTCVRILLVADPQLIGLNNEPIHFLTPLSVWDSDRYLAKTYDIAYKHARPNIVIFLGDLFDEGSISTTEEFESYVDRFYSIFRLNEQPSNNVQSIFIPGDNDIGGEGAEPVSRSNIYRFEKTFLQPRIMTSNNITIYNVNRITRSVPIITKKLDFFTSEEIRIVISHMPLMFMPSVFVDQVIGTLQPHVLFTAHEHKSMIVSTDGLVQKDRQILPVSKEDNRVYQFTLAYDNMYEFLVPTCSYRMGTMRIGYGMAVIESGEVKYTVLWSPSRFPQLFHYGLLGVLMFFYFLTSFCAMYRCCRTTSPGMGKSSLSV